MKTIAKILGLAAALHIIVAGTSGCGTSAPHPGIELDMSAVPKAHRAEAGQAVERLFDECSGLGQYHRQIDWVKVTRKSASADSFAVHERFGWREWFDVELKLSDDISAPRHWAASGHHLFYSVGSEGIVANKDIGGHFCGRGQYDGLISR